MRPRADVSQLVLLPRELHSEMRDDECRIGGDRTGADARPDAVGEDPHELHVRAALPVLSIPPMKLRSHEKRTRAVPRTPRATTGRRGVRDDSR